VVTASAITLVFSRPRDPHAEPAFRHMVAQIVQAVGGLPVLIVPHLYDVAPQGPVFGYLRQVVTDMILLAPLYPRAAQLVLRANGLRFRLVRQTTDQAEQSEKDGARRLWAFDYREYGSFEVLQNTIAALVARFVRGVQPLVDSRPVIEEVQEDVRPRWYPVIDDEVCVNCLECLNFCLFGVYDLNKDGRVFTAQPDQCRPGCPACARVCPAGAIVFPLYPDAKIAGGDSVEGSGDSQVIMLSDLTSRISEDKRRSNSLLIELDQSRATSHLSADSQSAEKVTDDAFSTERADVPEKKTLQQWLREAEDEGP
jgi:NAD-dependent dihydropyrimidine dehydrogenase PreA subunit